MLHDEQEHLSGRKAIMPALHDKVVQQHVDLVTKIVQREIASWPLETPIALHMCLRALTLTIILRTVFGVEGDRLGVLRNQLLDMLSVTASVVLPEPVFRHMPGGRGVWTRFLKRRAIVDELLFKLIDEHGATGRSDLLTMLLTAPNADGSPRFERQVRDDVMSIILAGHETTASELAWAFQLLSHHPAVLDRLVDEIDRGGEEYLTATIQEVLRHRPVFLNTIPRAVARSVEIGDLTYHPPTQLLGCIYLMHHDPAIYPEPQKFQPERFLETPPKADTWLPWGGGRKRCPGLHLALLEMKTVLRAVLSMISLHPAGRRMERARWRSVIVTPHAGGQVILHRRDRAYSAGSGQTRHAATTMRLGERTPIMSDLLAMSGVRLSHRRGRHVLKVLADVSLTVVAGEVVSVVASRGESQAALLRVAGGMERPDSGLVRLDDVDLASLSAQEHSRLIGREIRWIGRTGPERGMRMQDYVGRPLATGRRPQRDAMNELAMRALERAGVADCAAQTWDELSDRERALVEIARGTAGEPRLLLVDDLCSGLGMLDTREVVELLRDLAAESGFGVLMSVSDGEAALHSHRVWSLDGGRITLMSDQTAGQNVIDFPDGGRQGRERG